MPQNDEFLDLITRYLNNPTSKSLQLEVTAFRSASADNETYFLEIERVWNYSAMAARLDGVSASDSAKRLKDNLRQNTVSRSRKMSWLRGGAASILVLMAGYWVFTKSNKPTYLIKTTAKNQVDSVKLTDGSVVILAENSELKYPDQFDEPIREIFLAKGQAFFKVAKDKDHPFKVVMNESTVMVLGTSFNIRIMDSSIELGVKTGKVMFSPYKDGATSILTAGQALSYDTKKREFLTKTAENEDSWITKELEFVDTPLEEVCKQLTSYYGVVIKLQDDKQNSRKLNAKFKNQSLDDVLLILNEAYNFKIIKENNEIILITPKQIN